MGEAEVYEAHEVDRRCSMREPQGVALHTAVADLAVSGLALTRRSCARSSDGTGGRSPRSWRWRQEAGGGEEGVVGVEDDRCAPPWTWCSSS